MSQCPTYFGRKNKLGSAVDMMKRMKEITTPIGSKKKAENPELIERGIFVQEDRPEYCSEYSQIIERAYGGKIDGTMQNGIFGIRAARVVITSAIVLAESAVLHEGLEAVRDPGLRRGGPRRCHAL